MCFFRRDYKTSTQNLDDRKLRCHCVLICNHFESFGMSWNCLKRVFVNKKSLNYWNYDKSDLWLYLLFIERGATFSDCIWTHYSTISYISVHSDTLAYGQITFIIISIIQTFFIHKYPFEAISRHSKWFKMISK
jgi:hypothetical protein